jgi:putative drug exporter of the RND superfamily
MSPHCWRRASRFRGEGTWSAYRRRRVLIQARGAGTFGTDPQLRQATQQVVSALRRLPVSAASDIRSPLRNGAGSLVSADGRSALVTFNVTGANEDQAVVPALRAVAAVARRVVRHPAGWGAVAVIGMLALAAPVLGLRLGNPPDDGFPSSLPVTQTLNKIQKAFPEAPSPAEVVVTGHDLDGPAMGAALAALRRSASATGPIREPVTSALVAGGRGLIVSVPLRGNGTNASSDAALLDLRERALPATLGKVSGVSYAVTGTTANNYDDVADLDSRTPLVLAVVALLAFVLLLVAFRSVLIPLISVGLNVLSVGAGCGVVTLIFQDGRLQGLLGFTGYGAIVPWVPLFLFVFLFGLGMDYHVFILSRIGELRSQGASTKDAVVGGISSSTGVVTSAAVIMVAVFSILATLSIIDLKMLGVGLAAAVLIDATVARGILVPAALALLGERSWYLPGWLARTLPERRPAG